MLEKSDPRSDGFFSGAAEFSRLGAGIAGDVADRVVCLCAAIDTGSIEAVDLLLFEGFDVNEVVDFPDYGRYRRPLAWAILANKPRIAKHLIEKGAEVGNTPFQYPTFGASDLNSLLGLDSLQTIAAVQVSSEAFGRLNQNEPNALDIERAMLGHSPLAAACYMKSEDMVKTLLDAGAEFGDFFYRSIMAVFDGTVHCSEEERLSLLRLVFRSRDRVGFDRFTDAVTNFEQHVNGEWRRSLSDDEFIPSTALQKKAWRKCDRMLRNLALKEKLPTSQLLYAKLQQLSLDEIYNRLNYFCELVDDADNLATLCTYLSIEAASKSHCVSLPLLSATLTPRGTAEERVIAILPDLFILDDFSKLLEFIEDFESVSTGHEDWHVSFDAKQFETTCEEYRVHAGRDDAQAYFKRTLSEKHTLGEYRELFEGLGNGKLYSLFTGSYPALEGVDESTPVYYVEDDVKKILELHSDEKLAELKNILKCCYLLSLRELIEVKSLGEDLDRQFMLFEEVCGSLITNELSPVYFESMLDEKDISEIDDIFSKIKAAFRQAIANSDYLSEEDRHAALNRLSDINLVFAGRTVDASSSTHARVIDEWDFIDNVSALEKKRLNKEILEALSGKAHRSVNPSWTYNAAYNCVDNDVVLYAAYLQPPVYNSHRHSAMNYAALGRDIAHEIAHAFGPGLFDRLEAIGLNEKNVDIFSSSPSYAASIEKLHRQFCDKIPERLLRADPLSLLSNTFIQDKWDNENFADVVGLEVSLYAYALSCGYESISDLVSNRPDDVRLFFEAYAMSYREKPSPATLKWLMENDVHAPNELRVNTVKNLDAFHAVFNTSEGDGMWLDPEDRVSVFGLS
ncbi:MAG: M13-type metalloendopeptidase [Coriobacteriaceae bacterium]|nr:M13-type metalloendopeptidase [Coriobacteriaceae bacterium]